MRAGGIMAGLALCLLSSAGGAHAQEQAQRPTGLVLVVIVADSVPLTEINLSTLRRVFNQEKVTLAGGVALIPINAAPHSPERVLFDRKVHQMDPEQVGRYWIDQKIRGLAVPPKSIPSTAVAAKVVAKVKGAISYVPAGSVPPGAHLLRVEGALPEDAEYPLAER